ncbi:hypothetical protein F5B19DRAFT_301605 [Rostrohypoxylon terebratum]|nr:hypothetical protein F5B19DRAFT_301605 [Rostrohypoxylon terebratum]
MDVAFEDEAFGLRVAKARQILDNAMIAGERVAQLAAQFEPCDGTNEKSLKTLSKRLENEVKGLSGVLDRFTSLCAELEEQKTLNQVFEEVKKLRIKSSVQEGIKDMTKDLHDAIIFGSYSLSENSSLPKICKIHEKISKTSGGSQEEKLNDIHNQVEQIHAKVMSSSSDRIDEVYEKTDQVLKKTAEVLNKTDEVSKKASDIDKKTDNLVEKTNEDLKL